MKYNYLRRRLIRTITIAGILIGVSIPLIIYLYIAQDSLQDDFNKVKSEINNINTDYKKTNDRLKKAANSLAEYQSIESDKLPSSANDIMDVSASIREAREPLQKLKERYRLINLEMSLTAPTPMGGELKKDKVEVIDSKVTLKFSAVTDELALSFIDALIAGFPGYVKIESLNITRVGSGEVNEQQLSQIKSGNLPGMVNVSLIFNWMKLKDVGVQTKPVS